MANSNISNTPSTSLTYDLYAALMAQGIDPDSIDWSCCIDPAFDEFSAFN